MGGLSNSAASARHTRATIWMILPLYIFTLIFVACPLIYMVALSFATPGEVHGVQWIFTLDNYRKLLEPVYLDTFVPVSYTHLDVYKRQVWQQTTGSVPCRPGSSGFAQEDTEAGR